MTRKEIDDRAKEDGLRLSWSKRGVQIFFTTGFESPAGSIQIDDMTEPDADIVLRQTCEGDAPRDSEVAAMRIAVDVCVGRVGANILRHAGHQIVAMAEPGERDEVWFARAIAAGVDLVISADRDLEILCYDHRIRFFKARQHSGRVTVERLIQRIAALGMEPA